VRTRSVSRMRNGDNRLEATVQARATVAIALTSIVFVSAGCNRTSQEATKQQGQKGAGSSKTQGTKPTPSSARAGNTSKARSGPGFEEKLPSVDRVIEVVNAAKVWKDRVQTPTKEFLAHALPLLRQWSDTMVAYSEHGRRQDADRLAAAVVALRDVWGDKLFPPLRYDAFVRDRFEVGKQVVLAAQFFHPVSFYRTKDPLMSKQLVKYYRFSVYVRGHIIKRYYLERSHLTKDPFFVLTSMQHAVHRQLHPYGAKQPTYWELKKLVIEDLHKNTAPSGI